MSKESWVGFPDVQDKTGDEVVIGYTGMPVGLDLDQIQLNTDAVRRGVIGWGGYSAVTLAAYEGDEDRYHIGGHADESGVGTASSAMSVTRAESSTNQVASDQDLNGRDVRNGVLGIQWNIKALNSRLQLGEQFEPAIRAQQLNRVIRNEGIKGIQRHNTLDVFSDTPFNGKAFFLVADGFFLSNIVLETAAHDPESILTSVVARAAVLGIIRTMRTFSARQPLKEIITDPLFFSARPTRALAGSGILATHKLVRPTPKKNYK